MSRTASLVKHSPRGGNAAVYPLTNTVRNPRGGMFDDEGGTAPQHYFISDPIEDLSKKLGISTDQIKAFAKEKNIDLTNPEKVKELESTIGKGGEVLNQVKNIIGGDKTAAKSDEKKEEVKKPRTKDEVTQSLALRGGIAVVSGAGVGVGVGMATKNPLLGAAAGVGAFLVAAVVSQLVDPIKPEDLDKVFKSDAKPSTSTSTATTKAAETPKK
jgi:hypothetical protein